jgi:dihydroneopterin aldolase
MLSIHLKDLVFQAHHGLYEEEKILGNTFILNVHVHYLYEAEMVTQLQQVVNYETIFSMVQKRMMQATPLLETIAMELCNSIMESFDMVHGVFVSIEKTNPPIEALNGSVIVSYQLSRE